MQPPPPSVRFIPADDGPDPGEPADLVGRGVAALIEMAIWSSLSSVGLLAGTALAALLSAVGGEWAGGLVIVILLWVVPLAVQILLEASPQGQSYGKHLMRVAVVNARTGQPGIGLVRSALRQAAKMLSAAPLGLGFFWMLLDPQRRTWHDLLTGTRVLRVAQDKVRDPVAFLRRTRVPSLTAEPGPPG